MKRPMLVSGITTALSCVIFTQYPKSAVVVFALGVLVLFLCFFKKDGFKKHILLVTCCICVIATAFSFFVYRKTQVEPCKEYHNKSTCVKGKIISIPTHDTKNFYFTVKTTSIGNNDKTLKISVSAPVEENTGLQLYNNVYISTAYLSLPINSKNEIDLTKGTDGTLLNAKADSVIILSQADKTPYYHCLKLKEHVSCVIDSAMQDNSGAILKGMLFGEKTQLDNATVNAFRSSGIAHLLAVSGLHTSLWCGLLFALLKLLRCKDQISSLVSIAFLVAFCVISGFTPSVIRASVMTAAALIAPLFKQQADSFNSLGLAATLLLLTNPYVIYSISFQLSVCATTGVLLSQYAVTYIHKIKPKLEEKHLRSIINYILSSLTISVFAGLFTLPVSAYHFGVFSLASPLSNILCVNPAFYGMISGIVGVSLNFIPNTIINNIGKIFFDITCLISDYVVSVAKAVSSLHFCTIPIHKQWLITAIIIILIIALCAYASHKLIKRKTHLKITAVLCILTLVITTITPLCHKNFRNTITIMNDNNNIHLIIRSGTHYAYICNTLDDTPSEVYDYLPKATSETLDYYVSTYMSDRKTHQLSDVAERYTPTETRITKRIYRACISNDSKIPERTIIKTTGKYALTDEISFEIIDTTPTQYVIIKSPDKTAYVHLHGKTDLSRTTDVSQGDIFVYKGSLPDVVPYPAEAIIISADSSVTAHKDIPYLQSRCESLYITAQDGNITLTI